MASEYGSWPVAAAAHQMRMRSARGSRGEQRRHDGVAEMLERHLVAEEERLVRRHRLDHFDDQRLGVRTAQLGNEAGEIEQPGLARDRQQPALDEVVLLRRQHEAGARLQEPAQIVVIVRRHERAPRNSRDTFGAICSSGSTAEQTPAATAAPGMPQTTEVASSCAMTLPPALTTSAAPVGAVGAHAGQDQRQIPGAPDFGGGGKQRIDRGLAVVHRRAVIEHDHCGAVAARDLHVPAAGRQIDMARQHRLAVDAPHARAWRRRGSDARRRWW